MKFLRTLLTSVFALAFALGGATAFAQDSTPATGAEEGEATPVSEPDEFEQLPIINADDEIVAYVDIWEDEEEGGVWFSLTNEGDAGLDEGSYGVHVHEMGVCDPQADPAFDSAGGHFNPTDEEHGDINADPSHAGDLGNLEVDDEGNFEHEVLAEKLTLQSGESNSLMSEDGTALIIHSGEDDLETDPDGDAGDRWACAVIFAAPEEQATPEGMDEESPEATPMN